MPVRSMRYFPWLLALLVCVAGCRPPVSGPLPQRGYLWQRAWNPAVSEAIGEAAKHLQGVVLLGAEMRLSQGKPEIVRASIDWAAVQGARIPCALALRVTPFGGPFARDDPNARAICEAAKALLAEARTHGVEIAEFQLDFDCAQKKLAGYRLWLPPLRAAVAPARLVITTLPAWLEEREFARLLSEVEAFVLQVHSVPVRDPEGREVLCDPAQARAWVKKAAGLPKPFSVALPTYRCLAGYGPEGKFLGIAMEGPQPSWPRGTRTLELRAEAAELARLVHEWQTARPPGLRELLWYRVPVATDVRNWRWPTLAAVMEGRAPQRRLEVRQEGESPIDLSLLNTGEADEPLEATVVATWKGGLPTATDALAGWTVQVQEGRAVFTPAAGARLRLPPGERRNIGWLRYEDGSPLQVEVVAP